MTDGTVRSHAQGMAPDRVLAATGKSPDEWHALIDTAGGATIGHAAIASWIVGQGVEPWWAQGITIGYEQARGIRIPGQRSDGTFAGRESVLLNTEDGPKPDTVRISVQRERLTGPERMPDAKDELQHLLAGL